MPELRTADLIVVAVYVAAVTLLGCLMSRRTRNATEFIAAGRSLPGWVVGVSIIGTFVSSISFIANPGKSFSSNWNAFVFSLSLPAAAWFATSFFVSWYRKGDQLSAYERLEHRFGTWARVYAALFNVLYHIGRVGTILFTVSLAMSALLNLPIPLLIVVIGVLVIVYTLMGGIEAVIWTDVVQSVILIGGLLICSALLISRIPDGLTGVLQHAHDADANKLSLGSITIGSKMFASQTFWMTLVFGFFINLQNFVADQTYVQRYFATKSDEAARRSVWLGAIAYIPISALLFFVGTALFVFFNTVAVLPDGKTADQALPHFIVTQIPVGLAGLLIAAVLAAAMSTVDSSLNSSAALLLCDVKRRFGKRGSDRSELLFLRLATVGIGIVGIAAALAMMSLKSALDAWWQISGVLSGGTLGLLLLARFTRINGKVLSMVAVFGGVLCIATVALAGWVTSHPETELPSLFARGRPFTEFLYWVRSWLHPQMAGLVGTGAILVLTLVLSPWLGSKSTLRESTST
jgi:solute:Na+ symporter, SSS family